VASDAAIFKEPSVAKAELGDKQLCPSCGAKFYDLGKRPAVCPKCATAFDPTDEAVRLKRVRTRPPAYEEDEAPKKAAAEADDDEAAEEEEETVEVDEAVVAPLEDVTEEDEEGPANSDEIPAGFSEDVGDEEEEAADDDAVPILEDEEEEFPEDEIEIGSDEEDPPS
jgi:uncharacterized protein (TIGR02300 family)